MKPWRIGMLCLTVAMGVAGPVVAAVPRVNLGMTQSLSTCDGKGTYRYVVTWRAWGASRHYQINSGNQCHLAGQVCGISNKACYTQCSASGDCRAEVNACQAGRGSPWVQAYSTDGSGYQRITAMAPSRCQ
ncbi:MAG: hypothetical protein KDF24_13495 [Rhodocyclaceae bacterium]|nr:hypothetical protein [Rhodocyclaceae bacterium]MCB1964157.1 hypothetical protein [Rhodocyclaceae bacterium]